MSLDTARDRADLALRDQIAELIGADIYMIEPVDGGGNNRLHRVVSTDGHAYALKHYLSDASDRRDRLGAEFFGLSFLWRHGVHNVPCPVAADPYQLMALYHWADGNPVSRPEMDDIDGALGFLADLHGLAGEDDALDLPLASEACLSAADIAVQIRRRLDRLRTVDDPALAHFLVDRFLPCLDRTWLALIRNCDAVGLDPDRPLPEHLQTLSSSDFGFHNALHDRSGELVFVDFEYFGRDDPVKLTADFVLHPGMTLDLAQRRHFLAGCRRVFGSDPAFATRLRLFYPMYALRWCLILLNEFLPESWARRAFARPDADRALAQRRQLEKAADMLARVDDVNGSMFNDA